MDNYGKHKAERARQAATFLAMSADEVRGIDVVLADEARRCSLSPQKLRFFRAASKFHRSRSLHDSGLSDDEEGSEEDSDEDGDSAQDSGEEAGEDSGEREGEGAAGGLPWTERGLSKPGLTLSPQPPTSGVRSPKAANVRHDIISNKFTSGGANENGSSQKLPNLLAGLNMDAVLPGALKELGSGDGEQGEQQEVLTRGEEVLKEFKDMQMATVAELQAKKRVIPRQSATYSMDTQMLQAEFMVSQGMHLPDQDAYPYHKMMADDDWRFAPALPQRSRGAHKAPTVFGDANLNIQEGQVEPEDPLPATTQEGLDMKTQTEPSPSVFKTRLSAPSILSVSRHSSPKKKGHRDRAHRSLPNNPNSLWQAFSQAPAGIQAVKDSIEASFQSGVSRVPPLIPVRSCSDAGSKPGVPAPFAPLQPLLQSLHLPPSRSSSDTCLGPKSAPSRQPSLLDQMHRHIKLPPVSQAQEPTQGQKPSGYRSQYAGRSIQIKGWIQTGGGMSHRLLSGRRADKVSEKP